MGRRKNEPIDVFKYIDMPEDGNPEPCWPWTGGTGGRENDRRGYFNCAGVKWLAYRLVYFLVYGPIPDGEMVRHKCDNGICCNPYHLILGSQSDNENDKYDRERMGFPLAVIEAIHELNGKGIPQDTVARIVTEQHGVVVTQQRVSDIVTGARRARQSALIKEKTNERHSD